MKVLVGAFNQEKALVGAFSVIVQPVVEPMDRFTALIQESEREELRNSLVLTQESTAIQILLETCQQTPEEARELAGSRLADVQETQSAVCCYLHQAFIEDTRLAKLVHFQVVPQID